MIIRPAQSTDTPTIVTILQANQQYEFPEVDGPATIEKAARHEAHLLLVAEVDGNVVGLIRGCNIHYRPLINQLSVLPAMQGKGIGAALVNAFVERVKASGEPSIGVTVLEQSKGFWAGMGFHSTGVELLVRSPL